MLRVDLSTQSIADGERVHRFEIDQQRRECLLQGLDDIGMTLARAEDIRLFEARHREREPWMFDSARP